MKVIALDAGHGQSNRTPGVFDEGASHGAREEDELAYQLVESALFVATLPEFAGSIRCVQTRDSRTEPAPVGSRAAEAEREGADVLISVHLNSAPKASGTETYYRNAAGREFARRVQSAAVFSFGLLDRGAKHESDSQHKRLAVLAFGGPACLWEAGFINSEHDMTAIFGPAARPRRIAFWSQVFRAILEMEI